jgi:hypothetical protein
MATQTLRMLPYLVALALFSACATQPAVGPEEPSPDASTSAEAEGSADSPESELGDESSIQETPGPSTVREGLRLHPHDQALPSDDQFRPSNPGVRPQPPRPDEGAVIVRPPAE